MKLILIPTLLFLFGSLAYPQCDLQLDKAPTLRGISLGMTADQVVAKFGKPFSREDDHIGYIPDWLKVESLSTLDNKPAVIPAEFEGVSQIGISLSKSKVSGILINYRHGYAKWDSPQEFAAALSEKLSIPTSWTYKNHRADLMCAGWTMTADSEAESLMLMDLAPIREKTAADRAKAAEARKTFKP